jgi:hypothetical protein
MRSALIIGIAAAPLLLSTVVGSQTPPVEFDFKAAERRFESNDDLGGNKDANPLFAAGAMIAKIRDIRVRVGAVSRDRRRLAPPRRRRCGPTCPIFVIETDVVASYLGLWKLGVPSLRSKKLMCEMPRP